MLSWRDYLLFVLFFLILFQGTVKIFISNDLLIASFFLGILFFLEVIIIFKSGKFKLNSKFNILFLLISIYIIYFIVNFSFLSFIALFYYLRPLILFLVVYRYLQFISYERLYISILFLKALFILLTTIGIFEVFSPSLHNYLYFVSNLPLDRFPVVRPVSLYNSIFDYGFGALFLLSLEISLPSKKNYLKFLILLIAFFGILASFTRTIWLAGFILSLYLFINSNLRLKIIYLITSFSFGCILYELSNGLFLTYLESFIVLTDPTGSIDARFDRYAIALGAINNNPLGYGLGYGGIGTFLAGEKLSLFAENGILTLIIEIGLFGVLVWLLFFCQFWSFTGISRICIIIFLISITLAQNYLTSFVSNLFIIIFLCFDFNRIKFFPHEKITLCFQQ